MMAVALIVIEVETVPSGMPAKSSSMSSSESIATPTRPTSPRGQRVVGVVAHLGRQVEGDAQAADPLAQEVAVTLVGLGRAAKTGVLPHGPEASPIHRRLDAAGERETARGVRPLTLVWSMSLQCSCVSHAPNPSYD